MSYWETAEVDGRPVAFHVNSRARCKRCRVPLGVGTCERCTTFAAAMKELVTAATKGAQERQP
jgi:hypothetical protein